MGCAASSQVSTSKVQQPAQPLNMCWSQSPLDVAEVNMQAVAKMNTKQGQMDPLSEIQIRDVSECSTGTPRSSVSSQGSAVDACKSDPCSTDLQAFHTNKVFDELPGGFTMVQKLADGINGDIFEYRWSRSDRGHEVERVAVKKLRNRHLNRDGVVTDEREIQFGGPHVNVPAAEDPLTEIGVLSYLAAQPDLPANLLRLHGVFSDASASLTWLVTELAEGGELFNVAASGTRVPEADTRRYAVQILGAVGYLHEHGIGHRDVSLENVLLKEGSVKLMDFGMSVRSRSPLDGQELRFFRSVGKDTYRAPECYCPETRRVTATAPADAVPGQIAMVKVVGEWPYTDVSLCEVKLPMDVVPAKACTAEAWGYAATPADIFATGVCIFILLCQVPPWRQARLQDSSFKFVQRVGDKGLELLLTHWQKSLPSSEAMAFVSSLLKIDPSKRPSAKTALSSPWLTEA